MPRSIPIAVVAAGGTLLSTGFVCYSMGLTFDAPLGVKSDEKDDELARLRRHGFAIQTKVLSHQKIHVIENVFESLKNDHQQKREVSKGRIHYDLLKSSEFRRHTLIQEVIKECELLTKEYLSDSSDIYLSTMQIVESLPESDSQIWHRDNKSIGTTLIVPLVDLTEEIGTTEILAGSQCLSLSTSPAVVSPIVPRGSYVWMDSRCLHRGVSNQGKVTRPILVIRFDKINSPPPGMSSLETLIWNQIANFFASFLPRKTVP